MDRQLRHFGLRRRDLGRSIVELFGLSIEYDDASVMRIEIKDIFVQRIYDFEASHSQPRILDCGAHIGVSTLFFTHRYPASDITAFEPDPEIASILRRNLKKNGRGDVEVVEAALSPGATFEPFLHDGDGGRLARLGEETATVVRTVRLIDYLSTEVDFLKMNIEGAELDVLGDSSQALRNVKQMVIEYHGFPELGQYLHSLLDLLHGHGFRYSVHDFDAITNPATKPPFKLNDSTRFFLLVNAVRVD